MGKVRTVLNSLRGVKKQGSGYIALCPAHDDHRHSLSISTGDDGRVLLHCHTGCTFESILSALNLEPQDIFSDNGNSEKEIAATYNYCLPDGKLHHQTVRYVGKSFTQRRPDGSGGWIWNLKDIKPVIYNLPGVIDAISKSEPILIVEGEKDADNAKNRLGITATTSPMGAGKWRDPYSDSLKGARVIIIPDIDEPGKKHAEQVAKSLKGKAKSIKVLELPGLALKGDLSDWIGQGGTREMLDSLISQASEWEQSTNQDFSLNKQPFALDLPDFMQGPKDVGWLVDGLIPSPSLTVLAAKPKMGKSIFTFNLALSLRYGDSFIGRSVKKTKTLVLQLEDPPVLIRDRLSRMGTAGLDGIYVRAGAPMDKSDWKALPDFIKEKGISLVIIDPLVFAIRGNEQDATQMAIFLRQIRELIFSTNASVLLVHHHRKSGGEYGDAIRGSSVILGAVDVALELIREGEESPTATLKVTSRFANVEDEVITLDTETLTWESEGSAKSYKKTKLEDEIMKWLASEGELDIKELEEHLDRSKKSFYNELQDLIKAGIVHQRKQESGGRGRPKYFYSMASDFCAQGHHGQGFSDNGAHRNNNQLEQPKQTDFDFCAQNQNPKVEKNAQKSNSFKCSHCGKPAGDLDNPLFGNDENNLLCHKCYSEVPF